MSKVRVFTFAPDWGLPTVGPFALKLLAWLELAGIPYEQVIEANPVKGPKGKNPWIELDGERIGDSEVIIDLLKRRHGIDLDQGLTPRADRPGPRLAENLRGALPPGTRMGALLPSGWSSVAAHELDFADPSRPGTACFLHHAAAVWKAALCPRHCPA